jgi:hypothetical protein
MVIFHPLYSACAVAVSMDYPVLSVRMTAAAILVDTARANQARSASAFPQPEGIPLVSVLC